MALNYILLGVVLVVLVGGIVSCIFYWISNRTEETTLEKSRLIGSPPNEDLVKNYATRTMKLFGQEDRPIDVVEHIIKKSGRSRRHKNGATSIICRYCGFKNNRNAVYCFNCNGVIGRPFP